MENIMKRKILAFMLGGLILLGSMIFGGADEPFQNKEMDQFFKGKTAVFAGDWPGVRSGMESYLKDYPAGKMQDEALYWLARSLDRLAREARDVVSTIDLKRKALAFLDRLIKEFPESLWRDDAKEMQVAIAGGLAVLGAEDQRKFLEDAVRSDAKNGIEVKTAALDSIMTLNSKTSVPVMRNFLKTESDAGLRKRAVLLLGKKKTRQIIALLDETAKHDRDADVRKEAVSWLERIRVRLIPVQVNYYCYETTVTDTSAYAKVPEGKVASFSVPHGRPGSPARAKQAIDRVFEGRIVFEGSMAISLDATGKSDRFILMSSVSHRIGGFGIELDAESVVKTANDVTGRVRFGDQSVPFKVDGKNDIVLAARRGDRQAVMFLEMAPKDIAEREDDVEKKSSPSAKAIPRTFVGRNAYHTHGIVVYSDVDFSSGLKTNIFDYGQAKAEIPGSGGTWTLTGQLLLLEKERVLVGRMAKLVRPDGTTAASEAEIRVPVGNPAGFKSGADPTPLSRAVPESETETTFPLETGGWIRSPRPGSGAGDAVGGLIDFGTAQASLPGPRGNWTLAGHIVLLKSSQEIMAYKAVLTDPEGKTAAQGELLFVPIKNPEKYRLIVGRGR
jgi:hypothetical protein